MNFTCILSQLDCTMHQNCWDFCDKKRRTTFSPFSLKFSILPTHFICYNIWSGLFAIIVIWLHFQCWSVLSQKKMTFFGMVGLFMTSANLPVMSNLSIEHWQRNIFVSCITMSTIHIRKKSMRKNPFLYKLNFCTKLYSIAYRSYGWSDLNHMGKKFQFCKTLGNNKGLYAWITLIKIVTITKTAGNMTPI